MNNQTETPNKSEWLPALFHAAPITVLILVLFYYWFAIADRYFIFLYYHDMGPRVPDTSPFSVATSGRYWMAGLVANGAVMVLYVITNWILGRLKPDYHPPAWWRVWAWCAVPLFIGIPLITMTANHPTLPLENAAQVTIVTLIAVGLALTPGKLAAKKPVNLLWLALDGLAMAFLFFFLAMLQDALRWWSMGVEWRMGIVLTGIVAGLIGLLIVTALRLWRRTPMPGTAMLFIAGACVIYLLLPLTHHLLVGTLEGYFYISTASNFFARTLSFQVMAWLVVALFAWGATLLRRHLATRRNAP